MRKAAIRAALETIYFTGTHRVARPFVAGLGAILTFHRVRPASDRAFQPNRLLEITPEFLGEVIGAVRDAGIDFVSLDEAQRRVVTGDDARRFVALTFDDGYRDNLEYAWPILKLNQVPFAMYVASAFADGEGELWWLALERAVARHDSIEVELDGVERAFDCLGAEAKRQAFALVYAYARSRASEEELRRPIREIAFGYGVDMARLCREVCLGWEELAILARDPLVTIGAHTISHPMLAKLSSDAVRAEMTGGARRIEDKLGVRPAHFAFPVGGPDAAGAREFAIAAEAGFRTAVTTRPGVLFAEHVRHLTALPRISVNGEFQRRRYLDVLLSGAPTALMNGFRRVDAA